MKTRLPSQILKEEGWTTGYFARDEDNQPCAAEDDEAKSFCALGAIKRFHHESSDGAAYNKLKSRLHTLVCKRFNSVSIADFNDWPGRTAEDVIYNLQEVEAELLAEGELNVS